MLTLTYKMVFPLSRKSVSTLVWSTIVVTIFLMLCSPLHAVYKANGATNTTKLLCYYSLPREPQNVTFPPELNATLCTHILYICSFTNSTGQAALGHPWHDKLFRTTIPLLRKMNPSIKIMLTTCGSFPIVLGSAKNRTRYVKSVLPFLRQYDFDGLDFDYEFPGWSGQPKEQIHSFSLLMQETRLSFLQEPRPLLLSAAVAASTYVMSRIYEFDYIVKYLDFVNIMGYDFHGPAGENYTGYNSPLFAQPFDDKGYGIAPCSEEWSNYSVPKSQINVGMPTFCHGFTLRYSFLHTVRSPSVGPGDCDGLEHYCACEAMVKQKAHQIWDKLSQVPYLYYGKQWISYENVDSIAAKAKWVKDNGFGGIMVYSFNNDDYLGRCDNKTKFPLISKVHEILFG